MFGCLVFLRCENKYEMQSKIVLDEMEEPSDKTSFSRVPSFTRRRCRRGLELHGSALFVLPRLSIRQFWSNRKISIPKFKDFVSFYYFWYYIPIFFQVLAVSKGNYSFDRIKIVPKYVEQVPVSQVKSVWYLKWSLSRRRVNLMGMQGIRKRTVYSSMVTIRSTILYPECFEELYFRYYC